jgi:hypothetical protein
MNGKIGIPKAVLPALALGLTGLFLGWGCDTILAQSREVLPEVQYEPRVEQDARDVDSAKEFPVPFTPLPQTITPCRACHGPEKDFPVNVKRREDLLVHKNVKLNHGGVRVWCLDCHNSDDRNFLQPLSDGKPIKFEQSYLLCGKCHGTKFRDWRNGIHGKRTGSWNGEKTYYRCVTCHNPHTPKFKPIEPMPPPQKPWTPKETQAKH